MVTLNAERYLSVVFNRVFPKLTEEERLHCYM
jgi:hypothetical protein